MDNKVRIKVLRVGEGVEPTPENLQGVVNEWIKTREKSEVLFVDIHGNSTKGFFAVVTYNVVS